MQQLAPSRWIVSAVSISNNPRAHLVEKLHGTSDMTINNEFANFVKRHEHIKGFECMMDPSTKGSWLVSGPSGRLRIVPHVANLYVNRLWARNYNSCMRHHSAEGVVIGSHDSLWRTAHVQVRIAQAKGSRKRVRNTWRLKLLKEDIFKLTLPRVGANGRLDSWKLSRSNRLLMRGFS